MILSSASDFLTLFRSDFSHPAMAPYAAVATWNWRSELDDDDTGLILDWVVGDAAIASIELMPSQLQLTIVDRDDSSGDSRNHQTVVPMSVLLSFSEKLLTVNGTELEFSEDSIRKVIREFNDATAE